ncbi:MAG: D-2-hydroxyacid dehydrogenase [Bacteroidales bacterium]|nr:D-2-hydroxyacid dehydrogenase [Bacteroidales bacterium]
MKIVILDADTLGNDIDMSPISQFGDIVAYPVTAASETAERIRDAEVVISNKVYIGANEIQNAKNLKLVCVAATGYNNIDLNALNANNIAATNVKGYSSQTVAQLVFAYMLNVYGSLGEYGELTHSGAWQKSPTFTMLNFPIQDLENKTLGIIGAGNIGGRVKAIAEAFGMKVVMMAFPGKEYPESENRLPLNELLKVSDIVTLHCPLTPDTQNLIGLEQLRIMKTSAILINTSRGPVVNLDDLYTALKSKKIRHACIDVLPQEPPQDHPIFGLRNVTITPHIGWASKEARQRLINGISANIKAYADGRIDEIKLLR